ncbi:MAG: class I SAM-dependent methyltransferase [Burkholderiales bacterium]
MAADKPDEGHEGPDFYDNASVFATYSAHREQADNPNDTLELPVMLELIGGVRGLDFLDLGCGDGRFGKALLAAGAASYTGVDGSKNMIAAAARELHGTGGSATFADIRSWPFPTEGADCVTSRLVLHYIADVAAMFENVRRALRPNGRFVFSVEHPVITSCSAGWDGQSQRRNWIVDDYFVIGPRTTNWLGARVVKHHRTVEDYFGMLQSAGFVVESLRESRPDRSRFADAESFARRQRIPLFLFLAARRAE